MGLYGHYHFVFYFFNASIKFRRHILTYISRPRSEKVRVKQTPANSSVRWKYLLKHAVVSNMVKKSILTKTFIQ